jgi:hypothetical protein
MRLYEVAASEIVLKDIPGELSTEQRIAILKKNFKQLPKQCSEVIQACREGSSLIYRGMKTDNSVLLRSIRNDRRPVEMDPGAAEMLVKAYTAAGIEANRQNSIFATAEIDTAGAWGNVFIVFPLNGYKFSYFTEFKGQYAFYSVQRAAKQALALRNAKHEIDEQQQIAQVVRYLNQVGLTNENLTYALQQNCELLFTGTQYYAFNALEWQDALRRWLQL